MKLIKSYPAYDIIEPRTKTVKGQTYKIIRAGLEYAIFRAGHYRLVTAGSAASYAIENDEDPVGSYQREVLRGYPTHWLNLNATSLTAWKQPHKMYEALEIGDLVLFEGIVFVIEPDWNGNFKLEYKEGAPL